MLPSRVYWARRLVLLAVVVVLGLAGAVLVRTQLVSGTPLAASPTSTPTSSTSPTPKKRTTKAKAAQNASATSAAPKGPCDLATLVVSPVVMESSPAQEKMTIGLSFTTTGSAACTFEVSSSSVVLRITHAHQGSVVWSTQDCPQAITDQLITVGPHNPGIASLVWNGRASAPGCPAKKRYVLPGGYLLQAAAYGTEAGQMRFKLTAPTPSPTATASPTSTTGG